MSNIKVLAFDLSSRCIGVVAGYVNLDNKKPIVVKSSPIIPTPFNAKKLGYLSSKRKVKTKDNTYITSYVKPNEKTVSKSEKMRRDREVRREKDLYILNYIGLKIGEVINNINPDLILVEKNEIFNGILTTVLLSKIMGVLVGIASSKSIKIEEIKVKTARKIIDIEKCINNLREKIGEKEMANIPDITKRALRLEMENKYGIYGLSCSTDDEGDACVIFNYWLEKMT